MADIHLHAGAEASVTCVPNFFIDYSMKDLSGDTVMVYLYLLRCIYDPERAFSVSSTASGLGMTARTVRTSLDSLSLAGLVSLDYDEEGELCDICLKAPVAGETPVQAVRETQVQTVRETQVQTVREARTQDDAESAVTVDAEAQAQSDTETVESAPSSVSVPESTAQDEAAEEVPPMHEKDRTNYEDDPDFSQIVFIAERYLGSAMNDKGLSTLIYWYDDLHMSEDLIDYLITTTLDSGKRSTTGIISYMNSIAIAWYKKGIRTPEEASLEAKQHTEGVQAVKKAFGISSHALSESQLAYVDKWMNEWSFSPDLISEACSRTMVNISTPNFNYADHILSNWYEKGITSMEQIAGDDAEHSRQTKDRFTAKSSGYQSRKNGFNSYRETNNYDSKAIEAMLLKNNTF